MKKPKPESLMSPENIGLKISLAYSRMMARAFFNRMNKDEMKAAKELSIKMTELLNSEQNGPITYCAVFATMSASLDAFKKILEIDIEDIESENDQ